MSEAQQMATIAMAQLALLGAMAAAAPSAAARAETTLPTQCPSVVSRLPVARRGNSPPQAGIELLGGVTTGMSRSEVRHINHWLTASEPLRNVELVDGVELRGNVDFSGTPELAVSVSMHGISKMDKVVAALSRHYGRPLIMQTHGRGIDFAAAGTAGMRFIDAARLEWCDGPRRIRLAGEAEDFWVTVAGEDF